MEGGVWGLLEQRTVGVGPAPGRWAQRVRQHRAWVQGLRLAHRLEHHRGCVNTIEWHSSGESLLSSGDDLDICVWSAADGYALKHTLRTGHSRNVFCIKFVPMQSESFLSCGMDGDVRLCDLVHQGDADVVSRVELLSRSPNDMALKIEFVPNSPLSFLVTHQDGTIRLMDLRNARRTGTAGDAPEQIVVRHDIMFYSLAFDPTHPDQFATCCGNHFVRLYDLRMTGRPYDAPVKYWADLHGLPHIDVAERDIGSHFHITDVHFGPSGRLLANYSGHDVVFFEAEDPQHRDNVHSAVVQRFSGRQNEETFLKEVRFLGGREEFVCTGSDSGEVFVWETKTGDLVHRLPGDRLVVNGVAPHPFLPTLAACGIDNEVKIFEHRGGPGILEPDSLKMSGGARPLSSLSFRLRHQNAPDIVLESEATSRMRQASLLRAEGNTFFRGKAFLRAVSSYMRGLEDLHYCPPGAEQRESRDAERVLLCTNISAAHFGAKEYAQSERFATLALQLNRKCLKALFRRARARAALGNIKGALEDVQHALLLDDVSPEDRESLEALQQKFQQETQ